MTDFRYLLEAIFLSILMGVFKIMPLDMASAAGGWIGRTVGPRLAASRKAVRNIEAALPGLSPEARKKAIAGMWDNLGRVIAEYPHLEEIGRERVTVINTDIIEPLFKKNEPCMLIGAHLANWEISAATMLVQYRKQLDLTYRAPNNPYVDKLLLRARTMEGRLRAYSKSREGGTQIIRAMREGRYIGMLIDQKYNEGIEAPFFGMPAMTNPVFVAVCRNFGYPCIPAQIERTGGANFTITLHKPLTLSGPDGQPLPDEMVLAEAHALLEDWIRKKPQDWLWLHRRWKDSDQGS